jgi:hypothetical protein
MDEKKEYLYKTWLAELAEDGLKLADMLALGGLNGVLQAFEEWLEGFEGVDG